MQSKWFGAILIILGCGCGGFSLAAMHRYTENCLEQLIRAIEFMTCELQCKSEPLSPLCRQAAVYTRGAVRDILVTLACELDRQVRMDAAGCMEAVLDQYGQIPEILREHLSFFAQGLGRFDLDGQIQALSSVRSRCKKQLEELERNRDLRLQNYRTLGLCTGAALAILLI